MQKNKFAMTFIFALAVSILCCASAWAHKVGVYAYAEGDKLMGEGYFSGGDKAMHCPVKLYDSQGKLIAEGQTDANGAFALPLPQAAPPLKLLLDAGEGHRAEYEVTAEDLGQSAEQAATPAARQASPAPATEQNASAPAAGAMAIDAAQLERIVGQAVEQKIAPLRAQLTKLAANQPSLLNQIVGGLGWILGLVGIAAFFLGRRQK